MFAVVFTLLIFIHNVFCGEYSRMQNVISLNDTTFIPTINNGRWLIIFYRKSCGGCQAYSPFFEEFARGLSNWQPLIRIGAIDCEEAFNYQVCRQNGIDGVPHLKYFSRNPEFLSNYPTGESIVAEKDDTSLRNTILRRASQEINLNSQSEEARLLKMILESRTTAPDDQHLTTTMGTIRTTPEGDRNVVDTQAVYADDIFLSLSKLLEGDVGAMSTIGGEELAALKEFLYMLYELMPGSPIYKDHLRKLSEWVNATQSLTGKQWTDYLESTHFPLFKGEYVACKGSKPEYRGYPCGLWLLFHSLTVRHYELSKSKPYLRGDMVAHALNRFVPRFFSCTVCAFHFAANTANIHSQEESRLPLNRAPPSPSDFTFDPSILKVLPPRPTTSREEVLWLNAVHNRVNQRLSGSITEDPTAPKVAFPTISACPSCWAMNLTLSRKMLGATQSSRENLFNYLLKHYNPTNWIDRNVGKSIFDPVELTKVETTSNPELMYIAVASVLLTLTALICALVLFRCICRRRPRSVFAPGRVV